MRRGKLEFYRDAGRLWRWRLRASNGRILADSGEGYHRLASAKHAVLRIQSYLACNALTEEMNR